MTSLVAIDFGNSKVSIVKPDEAGSPVLLPNDDGETAILNGIYFNEDGSTSWGRAARNLGQLEPSRYVSDYKRSLGTDVPVITVDRKEYRARDVARIAFELAAAHIERDKGFLPDRVVISVPAKFSEKQKRQLLEAAESVFGKGNVILVHEPTAALTHITVQNRGDGYHIVLDIGGSTSDITIALVSGNTIQVAATNGLDVGGQDFNARIRDWAYEEFRKQYGHAPDGTEHESFRYDLDEKIEQAKCMLSKREEVQIIARSVHGIFNVTLTRKQFETLTADLVEEVMDCLEQTLNEVQLKPDEPRMITFAGGGSRVESFPKRLRERFGRDPWPHGDPQFCVVKGNLLLGRMALDQEGLAVEVRGRRLPPLRYSTRDVTAHPIGVAVIDEHNRLVNSVILPKGASIPAPERVERFCMNEPGQQDATIKVLQGADGAGVDECEVLKEFVLTGAAAVNDREHPVSVGVKIDRNGMVTISASDTLSEASAETTFEYRSQPDDKSDAH